MTPEQTPIPPVPAAARWADALLLVVVCTVLGVPSAMLVWRMVVGDPTVDAKGNEIVPKHPSIAYLVEKDREQAAKEGRRSTLKPKPLLRRYVPEHFGFKESMVHIAAIAQVEWLGVSAASRVMLGENGWLFIRDPPEIVDEVRGVAPLSATMVDRIVGTWRHYHREFTHRGMPFVIVLTPDKPSVEPEHLPAWLKPALGQRRADQILARIAEVAPELRVVDLRDPVRAAKASGHQVFQKTDTHWTDHGAFAGYRAMMAELAKDLPAETPILDWDDLSTVQDQRQHGGDLAVFLGIPERLAEPLVRLVPRQQQAPVIREGEQRLRMDNGTGNPQHPTLVMYRDSFAHRLEPYLSESFGKLVLLWPSAAGLHQGLIDVDGVMAEQPHAVVFELTERWFTINPEAIGVLPIAAANEVLAP